MAATSPEDTKQIQTSSKLSCHVALPGTFEACSSVHSGLLQERIVDLHQTVGSGELTGTAFGHRLPSQPIQRPVRVPLAGILQAYPFTHLQEMELDAPGEEETVFAVPTAVVLYDADVDGECLIAVVVDFVENPRNPLHVCICILIDICILDLKGQRMALGPKHED